MNNNILTNRWGTTLLCLASIILCASSTAYAAEEQSAGAPKQAQAPARVDEFIAGTYKGAGKKTYVLNGPANMGDGRTSWSLACTDCRLNMSWTTGSPKGNPDIAAREIAAELPQGFSYGVMGQNYPGGDFSSYYFRTNALIAARQMGNSVTLYAFYNMKKQTDTRYPTASVTLTLKQ